jgi:hypothetical protein
LEHSKKNHARDALSASTVLRGHPKLWIVKKAITVPTEALPRSLALVVSTVMRIPATRRLIAQLTLTVLAVPLTQFLVITGIFVPVKLKSKYSAKTVTT